MVVSVVILAVIVALAMPHLLPARRTVSANACLNNLRQLDGATHQWALENGKTTNDAPPWVDLRPYLFPDGRKPICDHGGNYTLGRLNEPPRCSYAGHSIQ